MGLEKEYLWFIRYPFDGRCPFCFSVEPNRTGCKVFYHKFCYRCSKCGAKFKAKVEDIMSSNYYVAKILIANAGNPGNVYENYKNHWIMFGQFFESTILTHQYKIVSPVSADGAFPQSCRLCKNGQNEENGESTFCTKFGFSGSLDYICDSYVGGLGDQSANCWICYTGHARVRQGGIRRYYVESILAPTGKARVIPQEMYERK